jgi:hypothetical protein
MDLHPHHAITLRSHVNRNITLKSHEVLDEVEVALQHYIPAIEGCYYPNPTADVRSYYNRLGDISGIGDLSESHLSHDK